MSKRGTSLCKNNNLAEEKYHLFKIEGAMWPTKFLLFFALLFVWSHDLYALPIILEFKINREDAQRIFCANLKIGNFNRSTNSFTKKDETNFCRDISDSFNLDGLHSSIPSLLGGNGFIVYDEIGTLTLLKILIEGQTPENELKQGIFDIAFNRGRREFRNQTCSLMEEVSSQDLVQMNQYNDFSLSTRLFERNELLNFVRPISFSLYIAGVSSGGCGNVCDEVKRVGQRILNHHSANFQSELELTQARINNDPRVEIYTYVGAIFESWCFQGPSWPSFSQ